MKLVVGTRGSNLALVQTNWVVDQLKKANPGVEFEVKIIKTKGDLIKDLPLDKIGDHICRVPEIKSKTNAKIVAHVNEEEVLIDRNKNLSAQLPGPLVEFDADEYVQEGDVIELGSLKLKIIHTPGHTKGGMCIKVGEHIFTGDTLFAGSIGRTDFYGGDYKQMMKSLRKLAKYDDNAVIYPGPGPTSTIGVEKRMNPYMQQI